MSHEKDIEDGALVVRTVEVLRAERGKKEICDYNEDFVRVRARMSDKLDRCYCCDRHFEVGRDKVNLVCFKKVGNKVVCGVCFGKLEFEGVG